MIETDFYSEEKNAIITRTTYDNTDVLAANLADRNAASETARYKADASGLVRVASISEGDVIRLRNLGYNLLSPDKDEWRRCLLYIQSNEPHLLTVPGNPFAKKHKKWS
jgi:hypothetical protein